MPLGRHLSAGLRGLFRKRRVDEDLDAELRAYLDASAEARMAGGLPREAAERGARLEMGSVEAVKDAVRDAGWERHVETVWQDTRYGLRSLAGSPGFTVAAVLTLALGVGANTAIFTVLNSTLLRPLPFPDPDRLVLVWRAPIEDPEDLNIVSAPDFWDWERANRVFTRMALFDSAGKAYNLGAEGDRQGAEGVSGVRVSAGFFDVLGVQPFLGRAFLPEEETLGHHRAVVLTHGLWTRRYGADPAVVNRTIRIDGEPFTVVGVLPERFQFQFQSEPRELFGLAPVAGSLRAESAAALNERGLDAAGGGRGRARGLLVAAEVALTLIVLCGAGLMIESMARLMRVETGFDPANVVTMETALPQVNTYYGPPVNALFCRQLADAVGGVPGVVSVGAAAHLPMAGNAGRGFEIEGRASPADGESPGAAYSVACPDHFRTLRIPILAGREFDHRDTVDSLRVIVINQAMADRFWPDQSALGRRITLGIPGEPWLTVVGVVGNTRHWGLDGDVRPQFFRPYTQAAWPWLRIVVRTEAAPLALVRPIAAALARAVPDQPVSSVRTMEQIVAGSVGSRRFPMLLLSAFALISLVLAAVGIVGVVSYAVEQRTHEIGLRVALGAGRHRVVALFVGRSMMWVAAGIAAGVAGAIGLMRLIEALRYEVRPADPAVLGAVVAVLGLVALAASYLPARRAARLDPVVALRAE